MFAQLWFHIFLLNQTNFQSDLFVLKMLPSQVLPIWVRLELGLMALKKYCTLPRSSELEPHQIQLFVITRTCQSWQEGVLLLCWGYCWHNLNPINRVGKSSGASDTLYKPASNVIGKESGSQKVIGRID